MPKIGKKKRKTNAMKLPNGFGSVSKLSGKRRNPYNAKITTGFETDPETLKTRQIQKSIGCFATREDAIAALVKFHDAPFLPEENAITFEELYNRWSEEYFKKIKASSQRTVTAAYAYCSPIYKIAWKKLSPGDMKSCCLRADVGANTKSRMKSIMNMMGDYAVERSICADNNARKFSLEELSRDKKQNKREGMPFTVNEVKKIQDDADFGFSRAVLIQLYSGMRPGELCDIRTENVHLEEHYMVGGIKTEAGIDRTIPIHKEVEPYVRYYYDQAVKNGSEYLINDFENKSHTGSRLTYDKYRGRYRKVLKYFEMGSSHTPHDPRHTFISRWRSAELSLNNDILNKIVGHADEGLNEQVYTHRTRDELYSELCKFHY